MRAKPSRPARALAAPAGSVPATPNRLLHPAPITAGSKDFAFSTSFVLAVLVALAGLAVLAAATLLVPGSAAAAAAASSPAPPNFSGRWIFSPAKSANVGMMASLELHATVEQSPAALTVHEDSTFQGQKSTRDLRYDLGGKPVPNRSPMGDPSETVSRWEGNRLVTTWTSQGAVAGTKVVRTETRSLSADGRTMTLESVRGSAAPMVMVFERE